MKTTDRFTSLINGPSTLQDPRYGVHKYVKVNGVKLHYVEAGSERDEHGELRPLMVGSRALDEDLRRFVSSSTTSPGLCARVP